MSPSVGEVIVTLHADRSSAAAKAAISTIRFMFPPKGTPAPSHRARDSARRLPEAVRRLLVTEAGQAQQARTRLARIGFDRIVGQLADIDAVLIDRPDLAGHAERLTVTDLASRRTGDADVQLIDIRGPGEQSAGLIDGAIAVPLPVLVAAARDGTLDPTRPTVVYCAGGYRSSIGASALRSLGFASVADLLGGIGAWQTAGQ